MRVLVTGGAGYIGSHTAKELSNQGMEPVVYDNLIHGHREACKWGPFIQGELHDLERLRECLREHKIEAVIHFAAYAYVGESMKDPGKYFWNNVEGSLSLIRAMRQESVNLMVFSSSCATYGIPESVPISEAEIQKPINPYGETKLIVERALHWYAQASPLKYAALRYFNAAGADKSGEIGEDHTPETHLIPLAIEAVLGKRDPLKIFGTDYATRDGTAERDYIHVEDLARAHVSALHHLANGNDSFCCNLGTGNGSTVREVLDELEKIAGKPVPADPAPRREGDPPSLVADPSLAEKLLGWKAENNLSDILQDAYRWHTK